MTQPAVLFRDDRVYIGSDGVVIDGATYAVGSIHAVSLRWVGRDTSKLVAGVGALMLVAVPFLALRDAPKECLACMGMYMGWGSALLGILGLTMVVKWAMTRPKFVLYLNVGGAEVVAMETRVTEQAHSVERAIAYLLSTRAGLPQPSQAHAPALAHQRRPAHVGVSQALRLA